MTGLRLHTSGTKGYVPPPPIGGYTFPTTEFRFPLFAGDGGVAASDGVINVKDYGATGNGTTDDTAAIQYAITQNLETTHVWPKKILFFPDGVYRLSGLRSNTRGIIERGGRGNWKGGLWIQGESEAGTILRLDDNVFTDPANPRWVIYQSQMNTTGRNQHWGYEGSGLEGYWNHIGDLTIDLGTGNTGAIGVNVQMHNLGSIRRVTVDGSGGGYCGFSYWVPHSGPCHLHRVTVKGCRYGIILEQIMCGMSIEHLKLEDQTVAGIALDSNHLSVRGVVSTNSNTDVPVVMIGVGFQGVGVQHASGSHASMSSMYHTPTDYWPGPPSLPSFLLVDAVLQGTGSGVSAIQNLSTDGQMFLRNISTSGYAQAAEEYDDPIAGASITEYASPPNHNLWSQTPTSLNLPIYDTPERPWPALADMTSTSAAIPGYPSGVPASPQGQQIACQVQLQAAIDNCATDTLYFPSGTKRYYIEGTVYIRGNVRHIMGNGAQFYVKSAFSGPMFEFAHTTTGPPVFFENYYIETQNYSFGGCLRFNTPRDVVILSGSAFKIRNTSTATGKVFLDDVITGDVSFDYPQDIYARQFNAEGAGTGISKYVGGNLWVLYWKNEHSATPVNITGAGSVPVNFELLGAWMTPMNSPVNSSVAAFTFDTVNASIAGLADSSGLWGGSTFWTIYVEETQGSDTRTLVRGGNTYSVPLADRGTAGGKHISLFRTRQ